MRPLSSWPQLTLDWFRSAALIAQAHPGTLVALLLLSAAGTWLAFTRMRRLAQEAGPRIPPRQIILQLLPLRRHAKVLLRYWKASGRERLRAQVYLDFRLIPAYVTLAVSAELLLASCVRGSAATTLAVCVSLTWVASGLMDVVENFCLLAVLSPTHGPRWQPRVFVSAMIKWILVISGFLGVLWTFGAAISGSAP